MVLGVLQLAGVNVRLAAETVPCWDHSRESDGDIGRGLRVERNLKEACPPASVVVSPVVGETRMPVDMISIDPPITSILSTVTATGSSKRSVVLLACSRLSVKLPAAAA